MILTLEQLVALPARPRIRTWKVAVRVGSVETHVTVDHETAEGALALAKRWAHLQPWTIAHDVDVVEHPAFAAPAPAPESPEAAPELGAHVGPVSDDEVEQLGDVVEDIADHNVHVLEPEAPTRDDRAVPVTKR